MKTILPLTAERNSVTFSRASTASEQTNLGFYSTAPVNRLRYGYTFDGSSDIGVFNGMLIEPTRTNYVTNTSDIFGSPIFKTGTQTITVPVNFASNHLILSFEGTGSIRVLGASAFSYTLRGTSEKGRVYVTFPNVGTTYQLEYTGQVSAINLEPLSYPVLETETNISVCTAKSRPSSWIPTFSTAVTRTLDVVSTSGILESDFVDSTTAWSASSTYTRGDRVRYLDRIYQSLVDSNLNNLPDAASSESWILVSTTNDFALLDLAEGSRSSAVVGDNGVYFSYIKKITSQDEVFSEAVLLEVKAKYQELTLALVTDAGVFSSTIVKQDKTSSFVSVDRSNIPSTTPVQYVVVGFRLHNGFDTNTSELFEAIQLDPTSTVSLGELVIGNSFYLGAVQYGMQVGITDYSVKQTNEFGITSFVKRGFSKKLTARLAVDNSQFNPVLDTLSSLTATPTVYIATDDDRFSSGSVIFGTFNDFSMSIDYPTYTLCSLELEGLVI